MSFLVLVITGLIVPLFLKQHVTFAKALAAIAFVAAAGLVYAGMGPHAMVEDFAIDASIQLMEYVVLASLLAVVVSVTDFERPLIAQVLWVGAISIALLETTNLFVFVVLFEVLAIISYVLVANIRNKSNAEGAVKTFIAGAVASGVILLGFAFYSFGSESFSYNDMDTSGSLVLISVVIMIAGLFYKMTIVPMHAWAADAYSQVNHTVAALLSGVIKSVMLVVVFRAFYPFLAAYPQVNVWLFGFFAIVTMTIANFMALWQKRVSRILAYSSIAHSGYALIPFAAASSTYAYSGIVYYAVAYSFMQTSVFLLLSDLRKQADVKVVDDLKGMGTRSPIHALLFTLQLFSLAGIPLLAGFLSKAIAFYAGIDAGLWPLVLAALLNSALAVGYYAWIIKHIYFDAAPEGAPSVKMPTGSLIGQLILLAGTIYFGVVAGTVFGTTIPL
jgi:NADH-quinone oxidoreductase subunit N